MSILNSEHESSSSEGNSSMHQSLSMEDWRMDAESDAASIDVTEMHRCLNDHRWNAWCFLKHSEEIYLWRWWLQTTLALHHRFQRNHLKLLQRLPFLQLLHPLRSHSQRCKPMQQDQNYQPNQSDQGNEDCADDGNNTKRKTADRKIRSLFINYHYFLDFFDFSFFSYFFFFEELFYSFFDSFSLCCFTNSAI